MALLGPVGGRIPPSRYSPRAGDFAARQGARLDRRPATSSVSRHRQDGHSGRMAILRLAPPAVDVALQAEVIAGLALPRKALPSKLFSDAAGAALFERICELDEYNLTRAELSILQARAGEIAARIGPAAALVEFGNGAGVKARSSRRPRRTRAAAGPACPTGPRSPGFWLSCARGVPGRTCRARWAGGRGVRAGAGSATGRRPGCGSAWSARSSTAWAMPRRSTGAGPRWTRPRSRQKGGRGNRAVSNGSRQTGE